MTVEQVKNCTMENARELASFAGFAASQFCIHVILFQYKFIKPDFCSAFADSVLTGDCIHHDVHAGNHDPRHALYSRFYIFLYFFACQINLCAVCHLHMDRDLSQILFHFHANRLLLLGVAKQCANALRRRYDIVDPVNLQRSNLCNF